MQGPQRARHRDAGLSRSFSRASPPGSRAVLSQRLRRGAQFKQAILGLLTMTIFAGGQPRLLPLLSAPYMPPITSDAVIDLSHWQAPVDFARAKSAGIVAVILKATQGSGWIDVAFAQRIAAARASGLLVGAYHFLDGCRRNSRWRTSYRRQKAVLCWHSMRSGTRSAAL